VIRLEEFDFPLPEELIAQEPAVRRDASRLLLLDRTTGVITHSAFSGIAEQFREGDVLVVNTTRVIPARLLGRKESGGKAEVFLIRRTPDGMWRCLIRTSKSPGPGTVIRFPEEVTATVTARDDDTWTVAFNSSGDFDQWLARHGRMPLPPYIRREPCEEDRERYQTVFASHSGAVAAPTAGLHMTDGILAALRERGVDIAPLVLHVGLGTFQPIRVANIAEHRMHREWYAIPEKTAALVNSGRRVVALGTTAARALEHSALTHGRVTAGDAEADIFIYPGYSFRAVAALITNFHLPKSTLLLLVSAFAGKEHLLAAYAEAVAERYRFFSYGDAMMIA
jgi:S-adenosylmethionine:tRNA ribosyltransferase-isomerase